MRCLCLHAYRQPCVRATHAQLSTACQTSLPPQALWEQFRRAANLYFLCISILSYTPISPVAGVTNTGPLALVVAVRWPRLLRDFGCDVHSRCHQSRPIQTGATSCASAKSCKSILCQQSCPHHLFASSDLHGSRGGRGPQAPRQGRRNEQDHHAGEPLPPPPPPPVFSPVVLIPAAPPPSPPLQVIRGDALVSCQWADVRVGDIVRVENGQPFPADLLLLVRSFLRGALVAFTTSSAHVPPPTTPAQRLCA